MGMREKREYRFWKFKLLLDKDGSVFVQTRAIGVLLAGRL